MPKKVSKKKTIQKRKGEKMKKKWQQVSEIRRYKIFFQKCRNDEINKTSEKRKGCSRSRLIIKKKKKRFLYISCSMFFI